MRFLSLGAGVQSSTLLLMMVNGVIPKADYAIFADTQWEPKSVYAWLDVLEAETAKIQMPIVRATKGDIRANLLRSKLRGRAGEVSDLFRCRSIPSTEAAKG